MEKRLLFVFMTFNGLPFEWTLAPVNRFSSEWYILSAFTMGDCLFKVECVKSRVRLQGHIKGFPYIRVYRWIALAILTTFSAGHYLCK